MADIDNSKLIGLLIVTGVGLLLSQKKRKKKTKTIGVS